MQDDVTAAPVSTFSRFVSRPRASAKTHVSVGTGGSGVQAAQAEDGGATEAGVSGKAEAVAGTGRVRGESPAGTVREIFDDINHEFVKLRKEGRTQAWAHLEEKLMINSGRLIEEGFISAKDWIGMAIEIESFRKSEAGTQQLPGDFLASWLSDAAEVTA